VSAFASAKEYDMVEVVVVLLVQRREKECEEKKNHFATYAQRLPGQRRPDLMNLANIKELEVTSEVFIIWRFHGT